MIVIPYTRDLPEDTAQEVVNETTAHVRSHLSAVASADDDPETNADDVQVRVDRSGGRIWIRGELDAEPTASYLQADFDPEQDTRDNPLSVHSILHDRGEDR